MKLRQINITGYEKFEVTDSSLKIFSAHYFDRYETEIPFEEIVINRIEKLNRPSSFNFTMTIVFGLVFMLVLGARITSGTIEQGYLLPVILGLIAAYFLIRWMFSTTIYYSIPTTKHGFINIYHNKPSKKSAEQFITFLTGHAKSILRSKYAFVDVNLPKEYELNKLFFLKDLDVITREEFEFLKAKLENAIYRGGTIGFKNNPRLSPLKEA
jgi:uncharacterized membrane protein YeaQ/YmgE (transglycosylase-associated protein family)